MDWVQYANLGFARSQTYIIAIVEAKQQCLQTTLTTTYAPFERDQPVEAARREVCAKRCARPLTREARTQRSRPKRTVAVGDRHGGLRGGHSLVRHVDPQ